MKKVDKVCATCKHLQWLYKSTGGDTWNFCPVFEHGLYIRISEIWKTSCELWEGKE